MKSSVSIVNFEHVIAGWDKNTNVDTELRSVQSLRVKEPETKDKYLGQIRKIKSVWVIDWALGCFPIQSWYNFLDVPQVFTVCWVVSRSENCEATRMWKLYWNVVKFQKTCLIVDVNSYSKTYKKWLRLSFKKLAFIC